MRELPSTFGPTRDALQRVATHVLGRRRHEVAGRFGLRATPGGFGTPAFGDDVEVVRVDGGSLVHERDGNVKTAALVGATLAGLAEFVGVDLSEDFSAGDDTPDLGDIEAPLPIDANASAALGDWYAFGWRAIDAAVATTGNAAQPTATQLWPEHFDAGCSVAWNPDIESARVNLGASPGDGYSREPYLYVGPWGPERPGEDCYWIAPFGATLGYEALRSASDPVRTAVEFLLEGVTRLG